tara:strand:- start:596 stop:1051 length:456 start_codon:yes stop_codon:yes gene_type:complete
MKKFLYFWEDFEINNKINLGTYEFTEDEIIKFGQKFDPQYFHINPKLSKKSEYKGLIASGWHTCSALMKLMCKKFLNKTYTLGSPGISNLSWFQPVRPGDKITGYWNVIEKRESKSKPSLGIIKLKISGINQNKVTVINMEPTVLIYKKIK